MRYDNKNTLYYLPLGHISFSCRGIKRKIDDQNIDMIFVMLTW
jgi:hypothetical protein